MSTQRVLPNTSDASSQTTPRDIRGIDAHDLEHVVVRIRRELEGLQSERAALARRIVLIKTTIAGLTSVFGAGSVPRELRLSPDLVPHKHSRVPGLTDACRELLKAAPEPQTVRQVCASLQQRYPHLLEHHRYPMGIVQMLLRRLVIYGEAEEIGTGKTPRLWKSVFAEFR